MNDMNACVESVSDGGEEGGDLVEEVYKYMMQWCYPLGCMEGRKQSIRRKALNKFVLKDGKLYFKKKKKKKKKQKGKVSCLECSLFHPIHRNVSVLVSRVARFYSLIKAPYMPAVPAFSPFVHVNKTTECLLSQLHSLLQVVEVRILAIQMSSEESFYPAMLIQLQDIWVPSEL